MLGNKIKELRKLKDITQGEMSRDLNIKVSTLSNYETGYSSPDSETLVKIADYFNVSTDYLLGREKKISIETLEQGYIAGSDGYDLSDMTDEEKQNYLKELSHYATFLKTQYKKL